MRIRILLTAAVAAVAVPLAGTSAAQPADEKARTAPALTPAVTAAIAPAAGSAVDCPPVDPTPDAARYFCGSALFGPAVLPNTPPVAKLVQGYERLGKLTPAGFLTRNRAGSSWLYPPGNGFKIIDGAPRMTVVTLRVGKKYDRFGSNQGSFLAPAGTPFAQRALPPDSLNTPTGGQPVDNYHCFEVVKAFKVQEGPVAPAFEQPGDGLQQWLQPELKPADVTLKDGERYGVGPLLRAKYLTEHEGKDITKCAA